MPNKIKIDLFSKLLRELESEMGTRDVAELVLKALMISIKNLDANDVDDFCDQFNNLGAIISQTEPKFGILNYHFANLGLEFKKDLACKKCSAKHWKKFALKRLNLILKEARKSKSDILHNSDKLKVNGKTILIHDHSHTVQDILVHYKKAGHKFNVVIAEQDFDKSHSNIEKLHAARIPFKVVPSYMISHIHDDIDMVFFGALTLKDTMHFVMDPGSHGIISEFHLEKTPVYMFIETAKFSLWKSKKKGEIFMRKHVRKHHSKPIEYDKIKYSHDRVPVNLFTNVISDLGIFDAAGIEKVFKEKYEKYKLVNV